MRQNISVFVLICAALLAVTGLSAQPIYTTSSSNSGLVGIGQATPSAKLHISHPSSLGANPGLSIEIPADNNQANGYNFYVLGNEGGTNPHVQLTTGSAQSRMTLKCASFTDKAPRLQMTSPDDASANKGWAIFDYGSREHFLPTASFKMRWMPGNATDPSIDMIQAEGSTGVYLAPTVGNVGIGTNNPVEKLDVEGNIRIAGTGNGLVFPDGSVQTTAATGSGGGGATFLNDLSDVNAFAATGDYLMYNGVEWSAGPIATGAYYLNELYNVNSGTPSTGDYLMYDGTEWTYAAMSSTGDTDWTSNTNGIYNNTDNVAVGTVPSSTYKFRAETQDDARYTAYFRNESTTSSTAYGIYNLNSADSASTRYGFFNQVSSTGNGTRYGITNRTYQNSSDNSTFYGLDNRSYPGGSGTKYGIYNRIFDSNTPTGTIYGSYNYLDAPSSNNSDLYGVYSTVIGGGTGTKYGVYSVVDEAEGYAAYLNGKMYLANALETDTDLEILSADTLARISLYQDMSGTGHSSEVFFGEDRNGAYGVAIKYDGTDNLLMIAGESNGTRYAPGMVMERNTGEVGFGTDDIPTGYRMAVDGKIICEELKVQLSGSWPDYVFADEYELMSLKELEDQIQKEKHLPGIPSAKEMEAEGITIGEMQRKMMEKIEELTLYIIEQDKRIEAQAKEIEQLKK